MKLADFSDAEIEAVIKHYLDGTGLDRSYLSDDEVSSLMNTTGGAFIVVSVRMDKLKADVISALRLDKGANQ